MVRNFVKLLHYASLIGLAGGIVVSLLLGYAIDATSPSGAASMRAVIALVYGSVIVPSLVVLVLSGMLLVVARPQLINARWVWLKAAIASLVGGLVLLGLQPLAISVAAATATGALGDAAISPLAKLVETEFLLAAATLAGVVLAMIVAIWRPQLRGKETY